jgi:hypothetical protein
LHPEHGGPWRGGRGASADLLLVDGNPLEDIKLVEDPAKNFDVIMTDGQVYTNVGISEVGRKQRPATTTPEAV